MKKNKKEFIISIVAIVLIVVLIVGATFAYFVSQAGDASSVDIDVTTTTTDNLTFSTGSEISLSATMSNFGTGMSSLTGSTSATATLTANNATNSASATYYVYLRISINGFTYTADESTPELILTITDPNGDEVITIDGLTYYSSVEDNTGEVYSGFDITTSKGLITIAEDYEITATDTTVHEWTVTVTFINLTTDQSDNAGVEINAELIIGEDEEQETLAEYIMSLHSVDGTNSLYYFDGKGSYTNADLEAGDYSYRYSGASDDVSNFVCFGSDDCDDTDNLYRIIGVFENDSGEYQVKLIKYDYCTSDMCGGDGAGDYYGIGSPNNDYYQGSQSTISLYYWNCVNYSTAYSATGYYNNWSYSALNTVNLNTNYYNSLDSTWQDMIAKHTWIVGGKTYSNILVSSAYNAYINEIVDPELNQVQSTYDDEIGIIYVSDYYYSANPQYWSYVGYDEINSNDYRESITYNWMFMGTYEWTITRSTSRSVENLSYELAYVISDIGITAISLIHDRYNALRPTFYLETSAVISSGSGTADDPYRIQT